MPRIAVLGSGGWGTALAVHLARLGHDVRLWGRDAELVARVRQERMNAVYLPDVALPPAIEVVADLAAALAGTTIVVAAIPSHGLRSTLRQARPHVPAGVPVVSATKGLEEGSHRRMSEVVAEELGDGRSVVVLSGPSFAAEVARQQPTAVAVGSADPRAAELIQREFRGRAFRLYATDDVIGIELGGAMKNVIAIAAGVSEALGLGQNAVAALITRGLAEMSRLALAVGARPDTLAGLSGLGDLVLTCTGSLSRNRYVGMELGRGRRLADVLAEMKMVAEGVRTTAAALELGAAFGVELPIACQMSCVLAGHKAPLAAAEELMLRPQRAEPERRPHAEPSGRSGEGE